MRGGVRGRGRARDERALARYIGEVYKVHEEIRDHGCAAHRRDRGHGEDAPARVDDSGGGHMVAWVVAPEMWLVWVSKVPSHELTQRGGG